MAYAPSRGARIYYEAAGAGVPIIFVHEFGGDHRSWDDQMRHFSRGWHCISMAARGYPPSDCPDDPALYGQSFFTDDVVAVLDAAGVDKAHVVGLSMGGYAALSVGLSYPGRARSIVAAGAGSGAPKDRRDQFIADCRATASVFERDGIDGDSMGHGATRIQLKNKDPIGWQRFVAHVSEHPGRAAAHTLRAVQAGRPSLYDLEAALKALALPTLLIVGDEDEPCLDVNLWMKRLMPVADLALLPGSGHAVNLEEPLLFNLLVERFLTRVDLGQWRPRDPRAAVGTTTSLLSSAAALDKQR
jgi:pimeloyl-ACP methyl ester carboxylesterase